MNKMLTDNNDILMNELENIKHSKTTQEKEVYYSSNLVKEILS